MIPQAARITFFRSPLLLLCGLSGMLAFQGGCAIVGSSTGSDGATVSGGVAQVCIGCSAIPPETIAQLKAQGITEAALNQFFNLETAVEAHVQAQGTEPKGFSTAPQFTKMVNSSMASNG